jgi:hypothetical protein
MFSQFVPKDNKAFVFINATKMFLSYTPPFFRNILGLAVKHMVAVMGVFSGNLGARSCSWLM